MKITRVSTLCLSRLHEPELQWFTDTQRTLKADCALVVIQTDAGLRGVGEASAYGVLSQIRDWVAFYAPDLLGRDLNEPDLIPGPHGRPWAQRLGPSLSSYRHPQGWQGVLRTQRINGEALCVLHSFGHSPEQIEVQLPEGHRATLLGSLNLDSCAPVLEHSRLRWTPGGDYRACVLHLRLSTQNS